MLFAVSHNEVEVANHVPFHLENLQVKNIKGMLEIVLDLDSFLFQSSFNFPKLFSSRFYYKEELVGVEMLFGE